MFSTEDGEYITHICVDMCISKGYSFPNNDITEVLYIS